MAESDIRNCFHRFDDKLCEVLLSYLSFENKIKFECVSHQWQRCVFKRVYRIEFNSKDEFAKKLISSKTRKPLNCEALESVLKKCPNVKQVHMFMDYILIPVLGVNYRDDHHMDEVYQLIMKYCPNLISFRSTYSWLSREVCTKFNEFFGPQLQSFGFRMKSFEFLRNDFKYFKNLKRFSLSLPTPSEFDDESEFEFTFKEMTHFEIKYEDKGLAILTSIIRENPEIRCLGIYEFGAQPSKFDQLVSEMTGLTQLKYLKVIFYSQEISDTIFLSFKQLGQTCGQLKKLKLGNSGGELHFPTKILKMMKYFPVLTRLTLVDYTWPGYVSKLNEHTIICGETNCQSLKDCPNLTHLDLRINKLKDIFFTDIDKHLPNLEFLKITNSEVTESIVDSIVKLKNFRTLHLKNKKRTESEVLYRFGLREATKLFKECPRMKLLKIQYRKYEYNYIKFGSSFWMKVDHGKKDKKK